MSIDDNVGEIDDVCHGCVAIGKIERRMTNNHFRIDGAHVEGSILVIELSRE